MIRMAILAAMMTLSACASTQMQGFVGKPIEEAYMRYGPPENVFDLPDGRRAFQFRWGGGTTVVPGYSTTNVATYGDTAQATTVGSPGAVINSPGCLVTLIGHPVGTSFVVDEYRIPKTLIC
jgi:hypothetical protein